MLIVWRKILSKEKGESLFTQIPLHSPSWQVTSGNSGVSLQTFILFKDQYIESKGRLVFPPYK